MSLQNKLFVTLAICLVLWLQMVASNPTILGPSGRDPRVGAIGQNHNQFNNQLDNGLQRDFGCNGPMNHNDVQCDKHCKDSGFSGGYCNVAFGWYRCECHP